MSVNGSNNFLNIEDANLRVRNGSVHAQGMTIGGAIVSASHGLQSVSDTSNTTSNTLQFTNATTAFKATSNLELTANTAIVVESNVLMDFKTLGQIEFPGSTVEQEYPPRALTGYETLVEGHGVFCAYVSSPRPVLGAMTQLEAVQYNANVPGTLSGWNNQKLFWRNNDGLTMVFYYTSDGGQYNFANPSTDFTESTWHGYTPSDLNLFPGADEVWVRRIGTTSYQATGIKDPLNYSADLFGPFNKNEALTDFWESGASTYTSTSGGSPAVSTERLASNAPYGSWAVSYTHLTLPTNREV